MSVTPYAPAVASCPEAVPRTDAAVASAVLRPRAAQRFYYPELDSIRIFLFLAVWSYHVLPKQESLYSVRHIPPVLAGLIVGAIKAGMCSLDVFFILSAFLITELLLRERDLNGVADLKAFYIRRLLRIWPLYFFVIGLAGLLSLLDRTQVVGWAYAISFLLFAGNWMMVLRGSPQSIMIVPLWSVSFEEQFYLLWPLVLRKASKKTICAIAFGLLALATLTRLILLHEHGGGDSIWYNTFARLDSIACGLLLAVILHGRTTFRIGLPARLALLVMGATAWMVVGRYCALLDSVPTLAGGLIGYPLMSLGGSAIFLSVLGAAQDGFPFLRYSGLIYLGKISYGLYAFHILGFQLSNYLFSRYQASHGWSLSWLCALAITSLFAAASFKWLESPFLRLKRKKFTYVPSGPDV